MNDLINVVVNYVTASFASIFIFGILTGWLIEWLFYNFIWKNSNKNKKTEVEVDINTSSKVVEKTQETTKEKDIDTSTSSGATEKSQKAVKLDASVF